GRGKGELFINSSGNPQLAQGGSGDVLAGYLAGFLAQGQLQANPTTALRYGVWQHGAAADRLSDERTNWTVENLLDDLGSRKRLRLAKAGCGSRQFFFLNRQWMCYQSAQHAQISFNLAGRVPELVLRRDRRRR